jgi:hypothetical protein
VGVNPAVVPQHLRQHIVPSVRRIFLDESPSTSTTLATQPRVAVAECGRLTAENTSLRVHCALWRKRAEVHAAATLGLLNLARTANIQAEKMKQERDELQRQCRILKRKLDAEEWVLYNEMCQHWLIILLFQSVLEWFAFSISPDSVQTSVFRVDTHFFLFKFGSRGWASLTPTLHTVCRTLARALSVSSYTIRTAASI